MLAWLCLVGAVAIAQESNPQPPPRSDLILTSSLFDELYNDTVWQDLGIAPNSSSGGDLARLLENVRAETSEVSLNSNLEEDASRRVRGQYLLIKQKVEARFVPELKKTLTPEQFTRLQQIRWQRIGRRALTDLDVEKSLEMTPDQVEHLTAAEQEFLIATTTPVHTANMTVAEVRQSAQKFGERCAAANKTWDDKINQILSDEQRERFAMLKGTEFEFNPRPENLGSNNPGSNQPRFVNRPSLNSLPALALRPEVLAELGIDKDDRKAVAILNLAVTAGEERVHALTERNRERGKGSDAHIHHRINIRVYADLKRILTDEQLKRLKQISLQRSGIRGLLDPEVIKQLSLTNDQLLKLDLGSRKISRELLDASTFDDDARVLNSKVYRERIEEQKRREAELIQEVLNSEQRTKLTELKGRPFEVSPPTAAPRT